MQEGCWCYSSRVEAGRLKEVYNLLKNTPKATVGDPAAPVSEYRHARNIVDEKLKQEVNTTFETFRFRGLKQREGEDFQSFTHRCEVAVDRCWFHKDDRDRHIRDQLVLGTSSTATREKALSENLSLRDLIEKGRGIESKILQQLYQNQAGTNVPSRFSECAVQEGREVWT